MDFCKRNLEKSDEFGRKSMTQTYPGTYAVTYENIDLTGGFWYEKQKLVREVSMRNVYRRFAGPVSGLRRVELCIIIYIIIVRICLVLCLEVGFYLFEKPHFLDGNTRFLRLTLQSLIIGVFLLR